MRTFTVLRAAALPGAAAVLSGALALPAAAETSQQGWTIRRLRDAEVTPAITANAVQILRDHRGDPYGTDVPFHADGHLYVGRIERHYHPPGGAARPWGEHPGVSVFEVLDVGAGAPPPQPPAPPAPPPPLADALEPVRQGWLTLRRGSRGPAVREVQRRLDALGGPLAVDGSFGPRTDLAVRRFQARSGIAVDGVVGRQTVGALDRASSTPGPASPTSAP